MRKIYSDSPELIGEMSGASKTIKLINASRAYLDYIHEHISNVNAAFAEVTMACKDLPSIASDQMFPLLKEEVLNHDISKLSSEEFSQYRDAFYPAEGERKVKLADSAWANHQEKNNHHWQTIMSKPDTPIGIREMHLAHMVIDWTAMSYRFGGTAQSFYEQEMATGDKIKLSKDDVAFIYIVFNRLEKYNEA